MWEQLEEISFSLYPPHHPAPTPATSQWYYVRMRGLKFVYHFATAEREFDLLGISGGCEDKADIMDD